jgi:preprotein translocase subunit SecF
VQQDQRVIDLVGRRGWFYLFSFLILLPGVISLMIPPSLKPGIDFTSGSTFTVRFEKQVSKNDLKSEMRTLHHSEASIQGTGANQFLVHTKELRGATSTPPVGPAPPTEKDTVENALRAKFGNMTDAQGKATPQQGFLEFSSISATLSKQIARNAGVALIVASFAIFVFLWWAFRLVPRPFRFGAAAILALLHDVLLVVGVFSILGKTLDYEINSFFITALLTVIGFSVHDSIVVFDRIRETVARGEGRNFTEMVNNSLLQTLGRSLNTSLTLIFAIVTLLLIGGDSIREFLVAMLVGTATGVYSSVFIASQILVSWEEDDIPRIFRKALGRPERSVEKYDPEALGAEA